MFFTMQRSRGFRCYSFGRRGFYRDWLGYCGLGRGPACRGTPQKLFELTQRLDLLIRGIIQRYPETRFDGRLKLHASQAVEVQILG